MGTSCNFSSSPHPPTVGLILKSEDNLCVLDAALPTFILIIALYTTIIRFEIKIWSMIGLCNLTSVIRKSGDGGSLVGHCGYESSI